MVITMLIITIPNGKAVSSGGCQVSPLLKTVHWRLKMIKAILRKTCLPFQMFFDAVRHHRRERLMMAYALKISRSSKRCG